MELNILSGFEEFQNTEEGRKLIDYGSEKEPQLKFRKVKDANGKVYVQIVMNRPLLRMLKDNKVFTFKLLFNEKTKEIAIKYDTSSNAFTMVNKRTRSNGDLCYQDRFVTVNLLPLFGDKQTLIYTIKCDREKLIYIFK